MRASSWRTWLIASLLIGFFVAIYIWRGGQSTTFVLWLTLLLVLAGAIFQWGGPTGAVVTRSWCPLVPVDGEPVEVTISLTFKGGVLPPMWLIVYDRFILNTQGAEHSGKLLFAGFKRRYIGRYRIKEASRGIYTGGGTELIWGDVFGWFKRSLIVEGTDTMMVKPSLLERLPATNPNQLETEMRDSRPLALRLDGDERLRKYEAGDPIRRIHWKGSAKRGQLLTKMDMNNTEFPPCLILDTWLESYSSIQEDRERSKHSHRKDSSNRFDSHHKGVCRTEYNREAFELAVSAAASWMSEELQRRQEVCLVADQHCPEYVRTLYGQEGLVTGIQLLSGIEPVEEYGAAWSSLAYPGRRIIVVTGWMTLRLKEALLQLVREGATVELWLSGGLGVSKIDAKTSLQSPNIFSVTADWNTSLLRCGIQVGVLDKHKDRQRGDQHATA